MKWATQVMEEEKTKSQTFSADGWTGESKIFTKMVKKWARTPLSRAKNSKNKWAEWLGLGEREGDKGPRSFVSVGDTNRDKKGDLLSRLVAPIRTKGPCPPLARLVVVPGIKATYYPGPKGCRDKWPVTKICCVVVCLGDDPALVAVNQVHKWIK